MEYCISGIQQVGIGVNNAEEAWACYRKYFKMNVPIFKDAARASLMKRYTQFKEEDRFAILALNPQGGGGFEIWQYTSKIPVKPAFPVQLGDTGIFAVRMKCHNIQAMFQHLKLCGAQMVMEPEIGPNGLSHFIIQDPYGNHFDIVACDNWFAREPFPGGGVEGCLIGVSEMNDALPFFQEVLGYRKVYDVSGTFSDWRQLPGGTQNFRRVLLHTDNPKGAFSTLLGASSIELVQALDRQPVKIFENRCWGDLGFIHLCYDVRGMKTLSESCTRTGNPFTVNSHDSFDMGKAAGHFTYVEDHDGTLIEFVETHKIPIIEKIGWYLDLRKREPSKPLPRWMLKLLSLNRVKD